MSVPELTCRELVEVVTDYLEGGMPAERRWQSGWLADRLGLHPTQRQAHATPGPGRPGRPAAASAAGR
jgi:hypothetical protein